jgi:hypothetical protein
MDIASNRPRLRFDTFCQFWEGIMIGASYPTKKALKASIGKALRYVETSIFGTEYRADGKFCVVGPDPYHRVWYAEVTMVNGLISKVK